MALKARGMEKVSLFVDAILNIVKRLTRTSEQGTRFKSIGKAALKGTKQIGKTLTAISDSPDRRAQGRLAQVHASQFTQRHKRKEKGRNQRGVLSNESLGLDGGK